MKILLTGANGFVGSNLLKWLIKNDYSVCVLVKTQEKLNALSANTGNDLRGILLSNATWKQEIKEENADIVIHLAAYLTSADDETAIDQLIESNLLFGTHLLDALKGTTVKYFINTGTFAEYTNGTINPAYLYAATKTAFRSIIHYYKKLCNFTFVNVIPYTIYGGISTNKKLIDFIFESVKVKEAINMSPGEQILDFIHIDDVIEFYGTLVKNISRLTSNEYEMHLGTGKGTTPRQLALMVEKLCGVKPNINWGGKPYRPNDTMYAVAPESDLKKIINWQPSITLQEGLNKI